MRTQRPDGSWEASAVTHDNITTHMNLKLQKTLTRRQRRRIGADSAAGLPSVGTVCQEAWGCQQGEAALVWQEPCAENAGSR